MVSELTCLASAPSGLSAVVEPVFDSIIEYDSEDNFCWDSDKYGVEYGVDPPKLRESVAPYSSPSCSHASVVQGSGPMSLHSCFGGVWWASQAIFLLASINCIIDKLALLPVLADLHNGYIVADTSATNYMLADKCCFISYKSISNLSICMGNNAYIPVLGCGTAIFSLN